MLQVSCLCLFFAINWKRQLHFHSHYFLVSYPFNAFCSSFPMQQLEPSVAKCFAFSAHCICNVATSPNATYISTGLLLIVTKNLPLSLLIIHKKTFIILMGTHETPWHWIAISDVWSAIHGCSVAYSRSSVGVPWRIVGHPWVFRGV